MARARGGYAALVLINGYGVLAFRDPWGIRPLCYGSRDAKQFLGTSKKDWCVASESVALECQDFDLHGACCLAFAVAAAADSSRLDLLSVSAWTL
jgi:glutamine phosphoribosylpyrophosphate amidotransferase